MGIKRFGSARVAGLLASTVLLGSTALVGLAAAPAGAAATPSIFRSVAGTYNQFISQGGAPSEYTLIMKADHTFSISGGGPSGTWSQPGNVGIIVMVGANSNAHWKFIIQKTPAGLGTPKNEGELLSHGQVLALWYATRA